MMNTPQSMSGQSNGIQIYTHNFDVAKDRIQSLSQSSQLHSNLTKVKEKTCIFFSHDVSGAEFNQLVGQLQNKFIGISDFQQKILVGFRDVYNALEYLDKEYIAGILTAIHNATNASAQAQTASEQALNASDNAYSASQKATNASQQALTAAKEAQRVGDENKRTIEALKKLIQTVAKLKGTVDENAIMHGTTDEEKRLSAMEHWLNELKKYLDEKKSIQDNLSKEFKNFSEQINTESRKAKENIHDLLQYKHKLSIFAHLEDVDQIWKDGKIQAEIIDKQGNRLDSLTEQVRDEVERLGKDISSLNKYRQTLESFTHLKDVDSTWGKVNEHSGLIDAQEKALKNFHNEFSEHVDSTKAKIDAQEKALRNFHYELNEHVNSTKAKIDSLKESTNKHTKDIAEINALIAEAKKTFEDFVQQTDSKFGSIKRRLEDMQAQHEQDKQIYSKRLNIAYAVSGSAVLMSLGHIIYSLVS